MPGRIDSCKPIGGKSDLKAAFHGLPPSNPNYDDLAWAEPIKIGEAERHKGCDTLSFFDVGVQTDGYRFAVHLGRSDGIAVGAGDDQGLA